MRKLWGFATVKDEEDIIESFVRYNMNILDGMVISDNGSNDRTLEILKELKREGYSIDILVDKSQYFDQLIRKNELLRYTMEKYNPDFVFPLDADEFIATDSTENPRKIIDKLDKNKLYKYRLRNYVLTGNASDELFIPVRLEKYREDSEELPGNYKCIISNDIYHLGIQLEIGAHGIKTLNEETLVATVTTKKLFLAHYPVRSKYQIINKTITGRLNNLSLHSREEGFGFHQYEVLDEIVKLGTISNKTLLDISQKYMLFDKKAPYKIKRKVLNISFCKKIDMKYTQIGNDDSLLSNTIKTSVAVINHMREENKQEHLEYELYKSEFMKIINSRTWRAREKTISFFKRKKK